MEFQNMIELWCKTVIVASRSNHQSGLPSPHFAYVKNISPGLPLFLFNYSYRKLYGIFEATSHGHMQINAQAWIGDGAEYTPYPAQLWRLDFSLLPMFVQPRLQSQMTYFRN